MQYEAFKQTVCLALFRMLEAKVEEMHGQADAQRDTWLQRGPEERYDPAAFARLVGKRFNASDRVAAVEQTRRLFEEGLVEPIGNAWPEEKYLRGRLVWIRLTQKGIELAQELEAPSES